MEVVSVQSRDFDSVSIAYDSSIDWDARLSTEIPFIVESVGGVKGKQVLDLACGTGRHAVALRNLGATVMGLDSSEGMIGTAKELLSEDQDDIELVVADMVEMKTVVRKRLDVVICLGNSLALLPSLGQVKQVMADVYDLLASRGLFVFQILNFEEILRSNFRFMPPKAGRTPDGSEIVFFRFFTHHEDSQISTLVLSAFEHKDTGWHVMMNSIDVLQLNHRLVYSLMKRFGFDSIESYSSYDKTSFVGPTSRNLIVVAEKP